MAAALDQLPEEKRHSMPLFGIPISVKESLAMKVNLQKKAIVLHKAFMHTQPQGYNVYRVIAAHLDVQIE